MFMLRASVLRGQVGRCWALWNGIELLGECRLGPKKLGISRAQSPPHLPVMDLPAWKALRTVQGRFNQRSIPYVVFFLPHCRWEGAVQ